MHREFMADVLFNLNLFFYSRHWEKDCDSGV